jgi:CheY-like chemotaxis protein
MPAAYTPPCEVRPGETPGNALFCLSDLIEEAASPYADAARDKNLGFRWFVALEIPALLAGNPEPLRRILAILLDNAIRYTREGEICLDVRLDSPPGEAPADAGLLLRFAVVDTGIGIERDKRASVFESRSLGNCRQIVQLMGGDLHFHSVPGEGATFWFTARMAAAEAPATPRPTAQGAPYRPLRILIAEDNVVNQLVIAEQLKSLGHLSVTVSNGREALAALENSPPWDAILIDCQMPVMDGYETIAAIRDREIGGASRLWAVAVTANALEGEREACLRAGMDDFLSKPFHIRELARVIGRIPAPAAGPDEAVDASKLDALAKSRISGGENHLDKMVRLFTESGREMLDEMDAALGEQDFSTVARLAHKLAGGCMYFGARKLHRLCTEAERLGHTGGHAGLRAIVPEIRGEYVRVEQALRRDPPGP